MELELLSDPPIDPLSSPSVYSGALFGIPNWISWVLIAVIVIICAFFSCSENAFDNCNKYHFKVLADKGNKTAGIIVKLTEKVDNTLVSVLVANNAFQTIMSFIAALLFADIFSNLDSSVTAIIATVVMAFVVYIIGDTIPKILADKVPNTMVKILAWPVYITGIILYPIHILFRFLLKGVQKMFKVKDDNILTKEDFLERADEALSTDNPTQEEEELFEDEEIALINKAFVFDTIPASSILTPLEDVVAIDIKDLNAKYVNKFILESEYSRFPIYDGSKDNIVGVLTINSYFKEYADDPHLDLRSVLYPPTFIYDDMKVDEVFKKINDEQVHIAIVKNHQEQVIGMVTLEDVLDELVGENSLWNSEGENI
ncbi:MAG: CNNM domain-containing protein [Coprobacillus sp.]|nr:CNNM domain-containing protein [Coprobacillus sp.]